MIDFEALWLMLTHETKGDFEVTPRAAFSHAVPEHMETVLVYCYRGSRVHFRVKV